MNYRLMFIINAIALVVFGALFLFIPQFALTQFGSETYASTQLAARFFGGTMLMAGVLLWLVKDGLEEGVKKNVAITLLVASVAGFILSVIGSASASTVIRANGWILFVIYGLFGLIYLYLVFLAPQSAKAKARSARKVKRSK